MEELAKNNLILLYAMITKHSTFTFLFRQRMLGWTNTKKTWFEKILNLKKILDFKKSLI